MDRRIFGGISSYDLVDASFGEKFSRTRQQSRMTLMGELVAYNNRALTRM